MNHLAFRRDTSDEDVVVRFAVQVGSPELLQMLYVLTAADLGAVGPDVWDGWKSQVLTDLYHRAMQQLAGDSPATTTDRLYEGKREEIRRLLGGESDEAWYARRVDALTPAISAPSPPRRPPLTCGCCTTLSRAASRVTASYEAGVGHAGNHGRHIRSGRAGHLPQAHRRLDQPGLGNPLGTNSHAGRRAGAGPFLGPRSRFRR